MQQTVLRLTPEQKRRQYIAVPVFLALAAYLAHRGSEHITGGAGIPAGVALAFVVGVFGYIGVIMSFPLFSEVRYDSATLSWRTRLRRHEVAWLDVTLVEVVRTTRHQTDRVRVHRRDAGPVDLPVLVGLKDTWRDGQFEAKTAHLIAAWREFALR